MALRLREINLALGEDESLLPVKAGRIIGVEPGLLGSFRIVRYAVDARRKPKVLRVYTVEFTVPDEQQVLWRNRAERRLERVVVEEHPAVVPLGRPHRTLVVGMGPAGLFAALSLARHGCSVILVEQGRPLEQRVRDTRRFWSEAILDPVSNVQFGEGGAGTFSDGKLTTRLNHPAIRFVLQTLVDFDAPDEILVQAKPHVGTDRLRRVLVNFRKELLRLGVEIRFETRLTGFRTQGERVTGGILGGEEILCDSLILAPGHSARDTYRMLRKEGVRLEPKAFAMGLRVEHPAELIDHIQYGRTRLPCLPPAEYALSFNDPVSGRGSYSFCMCPGGQVVNSTSEKGTVVVNGMSAHDRAGDFSNSALVVTVRPDDFGGTDPLDGVRFQQRWEEAAFLAGGSTYAAPAQNLLNFLGKGSGRVHSSCRPPVREADLAEVLPAFVTEGLRRALPQFDRKMRGFISSEAVLIGVETRTSAPLRILRGENGQSLSHAGLFPAGEGAGYAGGIMSAALDGLKAAEQVVSAARIGENRFVRPSGKMD